MFITYLSLGVATIAFSVPSLIWAAQSPNILETQEIPATLTVNEQARHEYIEGSTFDTTGITFTYKNIDAKMEDVQIDYDFKASGTRVVKFSVTEGNKTYVAKYPVTVYHVIHMDVKNHNIFKKQNADGWDSSSLEVEATLNANPTAFTVPNPNHPNVVSLKDGEFGLNIYETDIEGKYQADVFGGKSTATIPLYDDIKFSSKRVLSFYNSNQSGESLTLYVDSNSGDFVFPKETSDIEVMGTYVYLDNDNNRFTYPFYYHFTPGWNNEFVSQVNTTINSNSGLSAKINDKTFTAPEKDWHDAVLGDPEELEKYVVSFDANGGTGEMDDVLTRDSYSLPQVDFLAPAGKAFVSWSIDGDERKDCDTIDIYANTEIKAIWGDIPSVDDKRIINFVNTSTTSDKLTLYVESTDAASGFVYPDYISSTITVRGKYLFERSDGVKVLYPFLYTVNPLWQSSFSSNSLNSRVLEALVDDGYTCTINGAIFKALTKDWENAIIGEEIEGLERFTVSFDANGGTGIMDDVTNVRGHYALPRCTFIPPNGQVFRHWLVGEAECKVGDIVTILANTTIKAVWGYGPDIDEARKVYFENNSGTTASLTLFVEATSSEHPWISTLCDGNIDLISGEYLYINAEGVASLYPFSVTVNNWSFDFGSSTDIVYDRLDGETLLASIDGINFSATSWREAMIGEDVSAAYLDEQIAASNPRIAKMKVYETGKDYGLYIIALTTDNPGGFTWPDMTRQVNVTGKYVFIKESSKEVLGIYDLKYRLGGPGGENWSSHFESNTINTGFGDEQISGAMHAAVQYDPADTSKWVNFTLEDAVWQRVILGGTAA